MSVHGWLQPIFDCEELVFTTLKIVSETKFLGNLHQRQRRFKDAQNLLPTQVSRNGPL